MGKKRINKNIIKFPQVEALEKDVHELKENLEALLMEHDELVHIVCKNIETSYMLSLGYLEYKAYELQCTSLRLKRKVELIQAKINRQETVILEKIEDILDTEFSEYQKKLEVEIEKMNKALERGNSKSLSLKETSELKKLYNQIVKSLHPDLNPNVSHSQIALFQNAVSAYANGDLKTLRIIGTMVGEIMELNTDETQLSFLLKEKERLQKAIELMQSNITEIKKTYPYTLKEIIDNEKLLNTKKVELEETIEQYQNLLISYNERISQMVR